MAKEMKGTQKILDAFFPSGDQSHYREVSRWEIFMEQELRFGLDLGRMADFPAVIGVKKNRTI